MIGARSAVGLHAPDFPKGMTWINSEEVGIPIGRNRLTLIDFWTYSCVNCLRTIPHLKAWHEAYREKGLAIIGVHTPEFEFEKENENVERAVRELGISYPVVVDSEYKIWNLYDNHWWPRKLLVDGSGVVIYDHIGEGAYEETEKQIQKILGLIHDTPHFSQESGGVCYPQTPELYLGYERGYIGNPKGFARDAETNFIDPKTEYKRDVTYLHGRWKITREYMEFLGGEGFLILLFRGTEANIVAEKKDGNSRIFLSINGVPAREELTVSYPKLHPLVKRMHADETFLKLEPQDSGIRFYAFTFGGCVEK